MARSKAARGEALADRQVRGHRLRCVIYTRISRDDTRIGKANDRQEEQCRKKAEYKDYDIVDVVDDIYVSAFSGKDREGWQKVLGMIERDEVDVVLAYHLDRVTRSMRDLEDLVDLALTHNVGIDFATGDIELTNDVGRMVARIMAAVARSEVERKSARQKLAYQQRAKEGQPHMTKCFGYATGTHEVVPEEADALVRAAEDVLEGATITSIRDRWKQQFPGRAPASNNGVGDCLKNPRYAGVRLYNGENYGIGNWVPIFDMETHLALRALLDDPSRVRGSVRSQGRKATTLLAGIAKCGVCDDGGRTKATRWLGELAYSCRAAQHIFTLREEADGFAMAVLADWLAQPTILEAANSDVEQEGLAEAIEEAAALRKRKNGLATAFTAGLIDEEQLAVGSDDLTKRLRAVEKVLAATERTVPLRGLSVGTPAVATELVGLPLERQRALIDAYLDIEFHPRGKGNRREPTPIEKQVVIEPKVA